MAQLDTTPHPAYPKTRTSGSRLRHASAAEWRRVAVQSARDLLANSAAEWSAALFAFYAVLSLFPLLIVGMVLASYVADGDWATREATRLLGEFIPRGEVEIEGIVDRAISQRRRVGVLSLIVFLLTGRRILGVITKAPTSSPTWTPRMTRS